MFNPCFICGWYLLFPFGRSQGPPRLRASAVNSDFHAPCFVDKAELRLIIGKNLTRKNMAKEKLKSAPMPVELLNMQGFTASQQEALLDLLVLAMYLDGNLAKVEEARVQQLLTAMGFATEYDRNRQFDASVTRVRRESQTAEAVKACSGRLADKFTLPDQQRRIYRMLRELTALDGNISKEESQFLLAIKEKFGI